MKLQLKVDLIGEKSVEITLIFVSEEAMLNEWNTDNKIYQDKEKDITIWSFSQFIFDERQIRIPQRNRLFERLKHEHKFKSDQERYETLKKYYYALNMWALNTKLFPNTNTDITNRVIINDNHWSVI